MGNILMGINIMFSLLPKIRIFDDNLIKIRTKEFKRISSAFDNVSITSFIRRTLIDVQYSNY
jgi:hypothetical protein